MADLSQLYKTAPGVAAFFTGGQQATDDQDSALKQRELQQIIQQHQIQNQQSQVMNPLLAQYQDLSNQSLSAQIPGQQAQSQTLQQTANIGQATMPGQIAQKIAEAGQKTEAAGLLSMQQATKAVTDMSSELEGIPGPARVGYIRAKMAAANGGKADPRMEPFLQQLGQNPDSIPQALATAAAKLNAQQPAYQQHLDGVRAEVAGREKVGAGNNAATVEAARIAADSRVQSATLRQKQVASEEQQIDASKNSRERYQRLNDAATKAMQEDPPDVERARRYAARAEAIRPQVEAEIAGLNPKPNTVDIGKLGGLPTNPTPNIRPSGQGDAPANPLMAPVGAIPDQAKQAWGAYEPQKYDYRVGPNGVLQRKPKG